MALLSHRQRAVSYLTGTLITLAGLASCGLSPQVSETASNQAISAAPAPSAETGASLDVDLNQATAAKIAAADSTAPRSPNDVPNGAPQLVKRAHLALRVTSVDQALEQVSNILQTESGDILDLQDQQPEAGQRRRAYLRLRVPEGQLEAVLNRLAALGDIQQRSISAEDISTQLVDLQARLRNLRKSEAALLKLMERSGAITDVLQVSREISSVREQIEQLDAQAQNLQTQVSYSTLEVTLEAAVATTEQPRPLAEKVGATWQSATQSVGSFSVGLLQIGLWLLAYSPYMAILAVAAGLGVRILRRPKAS